MTTDPYAARPRPAGPGASAAASSTGRKVGGGVALVAGVLLAFVGGLFLVVTVFLGLMFGAGAVLFDDNLVEADGQVVDLVRSTSSDGGASCRAVISYPGRAGEILTFTAPVSESPCRRIGSVARVHVDKDDPSRVFLDPFSGPAGLVLPIFVVLGGVLLVLGVGLVVGGTVALRRGRRVVAAPPQGPVPLQGPVPPQGTVPPAGGSGVAPPLF